MSNTSPTAQQRPKTAAPGEPVHWATSTAKASWMAPLLGIGAFAMFGRNPGQDPLTTKMMALVTIGLCIIGLAFALISLAMVRRGRAKGILAPALVGLALAGGMVAIASLNIIATWGRGAAPTSLTAAAAAMKEGRVADAEADLRSQLARDDLTGVARAMTLMTLCDVIAAQGRVEELSALVDEATPLIEQEGTGTVAEGFLLRWKGSLAYLNDGDVEEAERLLRGSIAIAESVPGGKNLLPLARAELAVLLAGDDRFDEALAMVDGAIAAEESSNGQTARLEQLVALRSQIVEPPEGAAWEPARGDQEP